ncbi:unnamed protein product [Adineta ricciae]|uniref:Uncharacterized protein n=1 Tax=Adineta ricciae TaxID=249248 RepID=A0A815Z1E7_ADIRI|nr:unnamed protein product [Adineta ricciae]
MPLSDVDRTRRRISADVPSDDVKFVFYSYNESYFEEKTFHSIHELIFVLENQIENSHSNKDRYHWIEVINSSSIALPTSIRLLCRHFNIHPLTIEDITTLASYTKLDLFHQNGALYLLMKLLTWNGSRVEQQQISFYLHCSENMLITFQEQSKDHHQSFFQTIRNRLRRQQYYSATNEDFQQYQSSRLRQLNVDYLFCCLLDDIIDRYMFVMEEIAERIAYYDQILMADRQSRTMPILYSIYHLKHDLLHLRILFNPLKEIIARLQRVTSDDPFLSFPRTDPALRLGLKHHIVRRQAKTSRFKPNPSSKKNKFSSIYLNDYIYVYLNDLNHHIDQLIDSLEIQRESVSILISFWITLNSNEIQEILQILMLITVLFMPCTLLTAMNSTNFYFQAFLECQYGYYIILSALALIFMGMVTWYKVKKWI